MIGATDNLAYLIEASKLLNSRPDCKELTPPAIQLTAQAVKAEAVCLFLVDNRKRVSGSMDKFFSWKQNDRDLFNKNLCQKLALRILEEDTLFISNNFIEDGRDIPYRKDKKHRAIRSVIGVPLKRHQATLGVLEILNKVDNGQFSEEDLEIFQALAHLIAIAIDNARLYEQLKRESKEKHLLYQVGKKISSSLDTNEVLDAIIQNLHEVVDYDAVAIYLVAPETKTIKRMISKGYDQELEDMARLKLGEGIVGWVIKTGKGIIVPDVSKDTHYLNFRSETKSELAAPILSKGRVIGAFNVESNQLDTYSKRDLQLLRAFSSQAAISLEMAMLHEELVEKRRLEEEVKIARRIQLSFLPQADPKLEGFEISGFNIPSNEVSGDYYDFIKITDKDLGIVIGDVVGKGIPASIIMATFRAGLISEIRNHYSIGVIMLKVNQILHESSQENEFVTAFYSVLDAKARTLTYSNAGHNYPLLRRSDGRMETLVDGGRPLGLFSGSGYEERRVDLRGGDVLVLYTDGLIESVNDRMEEFGVNRLTELIEETYRLPADAMIDRIKRSLTEFRGEEKQIDDITIVIVKVN